jgi:rhodanese-related sulfurtransferase
MERARTKEAVFEAIAVMGKALASPRRLELLELLAQAPRTVDDLARLSGQSIANTSQHLQALHGAGLVDRERDGNRVRYELAGERALRVWLTLRDASTAQLAEVERAARKYLGEEVEGIEREELRARLRQGDVVLVDVRPAEEFAVGHIEGARSIPIDELEQRLAELPAEGEVVAYCRGPFCAYAHEAVRQLQAAGHKGAQARGGLARVAARRDQVPAKQGCMTNELDGRQPRRPGLLPDPGGESGSPLGSALPNRPLPGARHHWSRPSISSADLRPCPDRRHRRVDQTPSLRPDLEPRSTSYERGRRSCRPTQDPAATPSSWPRSGCLRSASSSPSAS